MSADLVHKLDAEAPFVEELRRLSGSPGLSLGVFHQGRIIYTKHFGCKDITKREPPDDDTIYYLASVSNIIGVCAVARLVSNGVLDWDVPIQTYLPEFRRSQDELGSSVTLRDLASHRTGLPLANFWWGQMEGEALLDTAELVKMTTVLDAVEPFRKAFNYSAWNYILIHAIVEKVTGKHFGAVVNDLILEPLQMDDTTFETWTKNENVAKPYAVRNNGAAMEITVHSLDSSTGLGACMGGKSSMKDALRFFSALLSAYTDQDQNARDSTPDSPFTQLRTILEPHIGLAEGSPTSYCLGAYCTKLPATLGCASINAPLLGKKLPVFEAKGLEGTQVLHHTGNMSGFSGSYFLLPSTQSGVVCLTNSTPLFDPTDFAAQIALSVLLDMPKPENLIELGKLATQAQITWYTNITRYMTSKRRAKLPSLPLDSYAGTYVNQLGNFKLVVSTNEAETGVIIAVQGSKTTVYEFVPLNQDTFYRRGSRDDDVCKGIFPYPFPPLRIVSFEVDKDEAEVVGVVWHTDMACKPDVFRKVNERERMAKL